MTIARSKTVWIASALLGALAIILAQAIPDPAYGNASGVLAICCIAASLGLALGARWARYLSQALLLVIVGAWVWVLVTYSIPNWPYPDLLSSVLSLIPGSALVAICLGVLIALRRHFRSHAL